jgi:hypothetical protein
MALFLPVSWIDPRVSLLGYFFRAEALAGSGIFTRSDLTLAATLRCCDGFRTHAQYLII